MVEKIRKIIDYSRVLANELTTAHLGRRVEKLKQRLQQTLDRDRLLVVLCQVVVQGRLLRAVEQEIGLAGQLSPGAAPVTRRQGGFDRTQKFLESKRWNLRHMGQMN